MSQRARVIASLLSLYLIWSLTYLAIRVSLESFPPLLMAGLRFVLAGAILYAVLRLRGEPNPSLRQCRSAALIGLMLCGANAAVCVAEQWVSSGIAAVAVGSMPLWALLFAGLFGRWPARREWLGLGVGLLGVVILQAGAELRTSPKGALVLLGSAIFWALGSVASRSVSLPRGLMAAAVEMFAGGAVLLLLSLGLGHRMAAMPAARPLLAFGFLVVFGSIVAYSAYAYLIAHVRPSLATSYAYVNPAAAVLVGALLAHEAVSANALLALAFIAAGVVLLALAKDAPAVKAQSTG